jgi:hypothetical protein
VVRLDRWWAAQAAAMRSRRGTLGWLRARLNHQADPDIRLEVRRSSSSSTSGSPSPDITRLSFCRVPPECVHPVREHRPVGGRQRNSTTGSRSAVRHVSPNE